jgi:hypothetical protein
MATKRRRIKRRKKPVEDYEEIEELDDEELEDVDDTEEEEEPAPKPKRTRRKRAPRVVEEEQEEDDEWEEEELIPDDVIEEAPAPKPKAAKKPVKKPAPKSKTVEVKKVDDQVAEGVFTELLEAMREGQAIVALRLPDNKWQFMTSDVQAVSMGTKLKGKEYYDEVQTQEYKDFIAEWTDLTYQEKVKKAKKLKVTWEEHDDKRVDNIRLMLAVREKLGIEKYKPDYINKSARDRLRGK